MEDPQLDEVEATIDVNLGDVEASGKALLALTQAALHGYPCNDMIDPITIKVGGERVKATINHMVIDQDGINLVVLRWIVSDQVNFCVIDTDHDGDMQLPTKYYSLAMSQDDDMEDGFRPLDWAPHWLYPSHDSDPAD